MYLAVPGLSWASHCGMRDLAPGPGRTRAPCVGSAVLATGLPGTCMWPSLWAWRFSSSGKTTNCFAVPGNGGLPGYRTFGGKTVLGKQMASPLSGTFYTFTTFISIHKLYYSLCLNFMQRGSLCTIILHLAFFSLNITLVEIESCK